MRIRVPRSVPLAGLVALGAVAAPAQAPFGTAAPSLAAVRQDPKPRYPRVAEDLGIRFAVATSKLRRSVIRTRTPYGFAVKTVAGGSVAQRAGIGPGTIVLEVDGRPLREVRELEDVLAQAEPGQKLVLHCVERKAKTSWLDRNPWVHRHVELVLPARGDGR